MLARVDARALVAEGVGGGLTPLADLVIEREFGWVFPLGGRGGELVVGAGPVLVDRFDARIVGCGSDRPPSLWADAHERALRRAEPGPLGRLRARMTSRPARSRALRLPFDAAEAAAAERVFRARDGGAAPCLLADVLLESGTFLTDLRFDPRTNLAVSGAALTEHLGCRILALLPVRQPDGSFPAGAATRAAFARRHGHSAPWR